MQPLRTSLITGLTALLVIAPALAQNEQYLGCYEDQVTRDLDGSIHELGNVATVELCVETCTSEGYLYAGVQASNWCLCGNRYGKYGSAKPESECNMACLGNWSQKCGSNWRNSVYQTANPATAKCTSIGDPHMVTFDNFHYKVLNADVPCAFHYVVHETFIVIGNLIKCHGHRTCLDWIKIAFKGNTWMIGLDGSVSDGYGNLQTLPLNIQNEIDITEEGETIKVFLSNGVTVTRHGKKAAIQVLASYKRKIFGLCGNYNDDEADDQNVAKYPNDYKVDPTCPVAPF